MGKRKEIKFMCRDGRTFEGRQDGVLFWIRENRILRQRGLPCYYVAANDTKGKGRTVSRVTMSISPWREQKNFASRSWPERQTWENERPDMRRRTQKRSVGPSRKQPNRPRISGADWRLPGSLSGNCWSWRTRWTT